MSYRGESDRLKKKKAFFDRTELGEFIYVQNRD